jgi:NTP pyrophosphatase (non-canonical NTP hydrolase)
MGIDDVIKRLEEFAVEREWGQFHTPGNLVKSISIEAAELLELYQWNDSPDPVRVKEELADVLAYCLYLARKIEVDPLEIVLNKIAINVKKYPVEKSRGKSDKYDQL